MASLGPEAPPSLLLLSPLQACSSFCFQPQTNQTFSGLLMSAELLLEPSPPSFSEGPQPWAGCQNFTVICSLEPELLSLLKRTVRKWAVYLIVTNSCNLALNCCVDARNCLAQVQGHFIGAPPDRKHTVRNPQARAWGATC